MTFSEFFVNFLQRIKDKDESVIHETIDKSLPLRILLPFGTPITNHDDFVRTQVDFFKNPNTSFDFEVILTEEADNLDFGVCVTRVKIPEINSYKEFKNQICFLFKKHQRKWILTFDQNTIMESSC